ncbi:helicase HerA-like domain-containing protein [Actinomyces respiraculi]|uniref:helicase HerA-like domain-containing protein n=1 Tax=Actinomyces respiraculi TaxID=2744574 RepID=UPI0014247BAB|nr:helicase HerA-like domain-containing protein [Actinomyces respiraculi]
MNDAADIARLRAVAAQAAADAAAAQAAAAQAALEAALASSGESTESSPAEEADAGQAGAADSSPQTAAPAEAAESAQYEGYAAEVHDGYAFSGNTLPVGTYLECQPSVLDGADPAPVAGLRVGIPMGLVNRHVLVAGATGTGKTRTLQLLAEGLSSADVPVFLSDVKGDLTGMAEPGQASERLTARTASTGQPWQPTSFPLELLTLGDSTTANGQAATPLRTTVTEFGPVLLARVLGLNETQTSALQLVFSWADAEGLALIDLKDLKAVVDYLTGSEAGKAALKTIGGVSAATAGVILREVSALEASGGDAFFGEPALDVSDLLRRTTDGHGIVSALELADIQSQGVLFSTFLMWLLGELFELLPEVGDPEKPTMVFFFDEAHLLFSDATKPFLEAVTRTVRLIRSKGVGIVFITQSPTDVPDEVLAQLGSRVQHALRAHTPADAAKLKKAVSTFPTSPLNLTEVLASLGTGQAVVSVLDEKGRPAPVTAVVVDAPASIMGPGQPATVSSLITSSPLRARYATAVDNESASEMLAARVSADAAAAAAAAEAAECAKAEAKAAAEAEKAAKKEAERQARALEKETEREQREAAKRAERLQREAEKAAERAAREQERREERRQREIERTIGSVGRQITRSILGNILRGR